MSEDNYVRCPQCGSTCSRAEIPGENAAIVAASGAAFGFFMAGILTGGFFWILGAPLVGPAIMAAHDKIQEDAGAPRYRCNTCHHAWR